MNNPLFNLPMEMRALPQWCLAGKNKVPYLFQNGKWQNASPVSGPWHTFEEAIEISKNHNCHVGFILTSADPFVCVDLDIKDSESRKEDGTAYPENLWTTEEQLERYSSIVTTLDSYTELSISGKGCHIWSKGTKGKGLKRKGVELYSQERFIVCTGNSIASVKYRLDNHIVYPELEAGLKPLQDRTFLLLNMVSQMTSTEHKEIELVEIEPELSDEEIMDMASNADNKEKFNGLCSGEWQKYGYPSQSEADYALMSMFAFYSKSNEQCRRLFRLSELGQRAKATDRYLNYALKGIRARQAKEDVINEVVVESAKALAESMKAKQVLQDKPNEESGIPYPPGMAGKIARFMFNSAMRPVKEVAIVSTLGLLAGICGKAYYIPQSGLNLYIILVARSAVGKEAMHSSVSFILNKVSNALPRIYDFVSFVDFASGPALTKECIRNPSFVNVAGEWGRKLKRLANEDRLDGPMQQLRTVMTNLYQKSGPQSVVGGMNYSSKENNVASVSGVAYSMIGESTPGTFNESLTETMMEDGFLSRFTVIEYAGDRPKTNKNPITNPDTELSDYFCMLVDHVSTLLIRMSNTLVECSPEAKKLLDEFDQQCDKEINATDDEGRRQMWNRAHLKVCRIAALLAVADNHIVPIISKDHVGWAMIVINRDIQLMNRKLAEGDIGQNDSSRERKVIAVLREYLTIDVAKGYKIDLRLRTEGIIPRRYLQMKLGRLSMFANARLGSAKAIDDILRVLIDCGYIVEVDRAEIASKFGVQGKCYRIIYLPEE